MMDADDGVWRRQTRPSLLKKDVRTSGWLKSQLITVSRPMWRGGRTVYCGRASSFARGARIHNFRWIVLLFPEGGEVLS